MRLQAAFAVLAGRRPRVAAAIRKRAAAQWALVRPALPGDRSLGVLEDDNLSRETFFGQFAELACPALNPADGSRLFYPARPLSCRTFGLPVNAGGTVLPPCHLNFVGANPGQVAAATVAPDPADTEGSLLERLAAIAPEAGDTVVAAALSVPPFENFAGQPGVFSDRGRQRPRR